MCARDALRLQPPPHRPPRSSGLDLVGRWDKWMTLGSLERGSASNMKRRWRNSLGQDRTGELLILQAVSEHANLRSHRQGYCWSPMVASVASRRFDDGQSRAIASYDTRLPSKTLTNAVQLSVRILFAHEMCGSPRRWYLSQARAWTLYTSARCYCDRTNLPDAWLSSAPNHSRRYSV